MSTYTITVVDDADEVLGRAWGFPAIAPDDTRTVQKFNQDYLESLVQQAYSTQVSAEAVLAAQTAASQSQDNIIVS